MSCILLVSFIQRTTSFYISEWNLFSILAVINFDAVVATETVSATRSDTAALAGELLRAPEDSTNRYTSNQWIAAAIITNICHIYMYVCMLWLCAIERVCSRVHLRRGRWVLSPRG